MSGECSAAPAPGHAGHLATFPAGLPEPRTGRMPHRQPRDRHPQMHHRQTGRRSLHARGTPANVRRSRSCRRFARRHSSCTPRLHRRNRSAFRARGAPTRYVHRAIPGPVPPGSLRASLSHPPVRASHQPPIPSALPGLQDGRTFAAIGPTHGRGERGFPVPRRHRPEVLCGGADHDSGRVLKRHGMRHPPAPG